MIRSYFVVFVTSAVLGILSGFMITTMLRDNMQMELQHLAQQLPGSRTDVGSSTYAQVNDSKEREQFLAEVAEVVRQAVALSLQQYRDIEDKNTLAEKNWTEHLALKDTSASSESSQALDSSETVRTSIALADEVLSAAIARGQWDATDAEAYREALKKVPADALGEAYQRLSIAINNGEIQLVGDAPL